MERLYRELQGFQRLFGKKHSVLPKRARGRQAQLNKLAHSLSSLGDVTKASIVAAINCQNKRWAGVIKKVHGSNWQKVRRCQWEGGPHCRLSRLYAVAYSDGEAAEFATAIRFGILFNGIKQHQKVLLGQAIVLLQHLNREQAALARPPGESSGRARGEPYRHPRAMAMGIEQLTPDQVNLSDEEIDRIVSLFVLRERAAGVIDCYQHGDGMLRENAVTAQIPVEIATLILDKIRFQQYVQPALGVYGVSYDVAYNARGPCN
ncbi:hypothetical protein CEQ31_000285 [Serratia odorifera]|uniref:hypothetical protein n=1 Tax=Serratia odorifera TaxID=618 RepID=UPI000C9ECBCB|nr:hypothetical protein [Serratia odorifera]PNK88264.1 hypothetical protein CEQ31_000285 [Serratia odorifera]